ncbi:putative protein serine/threonine kinase, partial [Rhizoclosmatium hyalinum]
KGSFGEVYKGRKKSNGQIVAIKVLDLDTDDEEIVDVQKEISVLSHIDNDYITRYHGSYLVGTKLWIVMDYAAGGSLRNLLKSGAIEERCIAIIAREILYALIYLHKSVKIIHRDIKAANILITDNGHVKLCDFGVAGHMSTSGVRRNSFVGTPYSPEIITRSQYDFKADIWSLGITIIELATGNPPFANHDPRKAIFLIPRSRPAQLEGDFSPQIKEFIALCLTEEPDQRPSAEELLKTRFIKSCPAKGLSLIRDLVARHAQWKANNDLEQESPREEKPAFDEPEEDVWIFDTFQSRRSHHGPARSNTGRLSGRASLRPPSKVMSPGGMNEMDRSEDGIDKSGVETQSVTPNSITESDPKLHTPLKISVDDENEPSNSGWAIKNLKLPKIDSVNDDYWLAVQADGAFAGHKDK